MPLVTRDDVYKLLDGELARALYLAAKDAPTLLQNDWERAFTHGIEEGYVRYGKLTWKQRKAARGILLRIVLRHNRRVEVRQGTEKL